jgi:integrase
LATSKLLTDAACRRYVPRRERYRIRDLGARSLYLVIEPSGFRAWEMRFRRPGGKPGKVRLGPFDLNGKELHGEPVVGQPLSLRAARHLCAAIHRQRAMGVDVLSEIKAKRLHQRVEIEQQAGNTFTRCAVDYINEYARPQTKRWRDTASVLGLHYGDDDAEPEIILGSLCDRWRHRSVSSITDHDLFEVISEAKKSGIPGKDVRNEGVSIARARDLHTKLSGLWTWLRKQRRVTVDPFVNLDLPAAAQDRDRVLNDGELRLLWRALDDEPALGPIIKLLTLTGARRREVSDMRFSELSEDSATWTIPGARTKNGKTHIVPLSKAAQALLRDMPRLAGCDFVFTISGKRPPSGWTLAKRRIDKAMAKAAGKPVPHWVIHDVRRSVATGMGEIGIQPHIIEAVLNHVSGHKAGVAGVYNRARYAAEKAMALQRWAAHVEGIVSGGHAKADVVPIKHSRRKS